jgi:hypothetical protein
MVWGMGVFFVIACNVAGFTGRFGLMVAAATGVNLCLIAGAIQYMIG